MYLIVGRQPVSWTRTEDGGSILLGWDFEKKELTQAAASWDDVISGERVTLSQFADAIRELKEQP